jgi:phosphohistidine phosphatase SixA
MRTVFAATFLAYALLLAWVFTSAQAADLPTGQAALSRLAAPGTHAILRHALAPGTGDPENFQLGDCSTQRNLDARGRAQSRAIGAALRAAGITADRVLTSQWCRSAETARLLGLGPVVEEPALNSFFADRSTRSAQTEATRRLLAALPREATAILVSHQVNITALTGIYPRSGEVVVIEVNEAGDVLPIGRFLLPPPS